MLGCNAESRVYAREFGFELSIFLYFLYSRSNLNKTKKTYEKERWNLSFNLMQT